MFRPPAAVEPVGAMISCTAGRRAGPAWLQEFSALWSWASAVFLPNVRGSGGFGQTFMHADDKEQRFAAIDDVADAARYLVESRRRARGPRRMLRLVLRRLPTQAALAFHPDLFAAGISICG